jgi:hypothetical protein
MPTPTCLLLGSPRTPTNEQHCPASNNSTLSEGRIGIQIATATATAMPSSYSTASPARSKSRTQGQATRSKSALPILKTTNLKSSSSTAAAAAATAAVAVAATDDQCRGRWESLSKSPPPPQPEILIIKWVEWHNSNNSIKRYLIALRIMHRTPRRTMTQQRQSSQVVQVGMREPSNINTLHQQVRHPHRPVRSHHIRHQIGGRRILPRIRHDRSRYQRRHPPTGRKLRHLFRRPPICSASDPPSYSSMRPSHRWWR